MFSVSHGGSKVNEKLQLLFFFRFFIRTPLTDPDELAVALRGWYRRRWACVHEWINVRQYCQPFWVASGYKKVLDNIPYLSLQIGLGVINE